MAKTPLLRAITNAFSDYRTANGLGVDVEHLRNTRRTGQIEHAIDRREFLRYGVAGAVMLALPKWVIAKNAPRIVIVGAGIAGLSCALDLRDHGIHAELFEASYRVGGRIFSNRSGYWDENQISEWGGELIDSNHTTMQKLARRFHLTLDNLHAAQPPGSEETYRFFDQYYPKKAADTDFAKIFSALQADANAANYGNTYDTVNKTAKALDHISVREWIESRVPGGYGSPLGRLLDIAYAIEYGADTVDQSSLNLVYMLSAQPDKTGNTLAMFGESDERFHIRGGNDQLTDAIAAQLGSDSIHFDMPLVSLRKSGAGRYRLRFEGKGGARDVDADFVVLALPFAVLRNLDIAHAGFDPRKLQAIREQGAARSAKLQLQFNERLWTKNGPWPGRGNGSSYSDSGYQSSWEVTRVQSGKAGILNFFHGGTPANALATNVPFSTARTTGTAADARQKLKQAESVFAGLAPLWNNKATLSLWHFHPHTRCSYSYYRVGQYSRFGGYEKIRQDGVLFCGEHTSSEFQGYMEGGAAEGKRASTELLALIGKRAQQGAA